MTSTRDEIESLLPSAHDVAFFRANGWWQSPVVLSEDTLACLRDAQDAFYTDGRQVALPLVHEGWKSGLHREDMLRKNDYTSLTNPIFMEQLIRNPFIGAAAARLMGVDTVRLWHDQLLYKPGRSEATDGEAPPVVGWHTDQSYWKSCTGPMITAWVPFTDCPIEMGPIAMVNRSHRWPLSNRDKSDFFGHNLAEQIAQFDTGGDELEIQPMAMKAGQMSFHFWQTIHGSSPNSLPQPRRSMAIHLQSGTNRWQNCLSQRTGKAVTHEIDALVRRDANGHPDYTDPAICPVLWPRSVD